MPELPDVEGYRCALEAHGLKRKIAQVVVSDLCTLDSITPRAFRARLRGGSFLQTRRQGVRPLSATTHS